MAEKLTGNRFNQILIAKNDALDASHISTSQADRLGITIGGLLARWSTEEDGTALLSDRTIPFVERSFLAKPISLIIKSPSNNGHYHGLYFRFDPFSEDSITVTSTIQRADVAYDRTPIIMPWVLIRERQLGLSTPSEDQIAQLEDELMRGASGNYRIED